MGSYASNLELSVCGLATYLNHTAPVPVVSPGLEDCGMGYEGLPMPEFPGLAEQLSSGFLGLRSVTRISRRPSFS